MLVAFLAEGHVLLEDVPGVGNSHGRALAKSIGEPSSGSSSPRFAPADITGFNIYNRSLGGFSFKQDP